MADPLLRDGLHPRELGFAYQLGHLEGRMMALEAKLGGFEQRTENKLNTIESRLEMLIANLNFGRGSWKTLMVTGSILMAVFTVLGQFLHKLARLLLDGGAT